MNGTYRAPARPADRLRAQTVLQLLAAHFGVPVEALDAPGDARRLGLSRARWLAIYLGHVVFGWPLERAAHAFAVNRATAGRACRWAEDERERPEVDSLLTRYETLLPGLFDGPRIGGAGLGRR